MDGERVMSYRQLRTPRAAGIAGVVFAVLFGASLVLLHTVLDPDPSSAIDWAGPAGPRVRLALTVMPFAGIAFLWFIGVVRDRLEELEDRFFSTVAPGSALLFLAMVFVSMATAGGLLASARADLTMDAERGLTSFGCAMMLQISNVYALRMGGVFMLPLGDRVAAHRADAAVAGRDDLPPRPGHAGHRQPEPLGELALPHVGTRRQQLRPGQTTRCGRRLSHGSASPGRMQRRTHNALVPSRTHAPREVLKRLPRDSRTASHVHAQPRCPLVFARTRGRPRRLPARGSHRGPSEPAAARRCPGRSSVVECAPRAAPKLTAAGALS